MLKHIHLYIFSQNKNHLDIDMYYKDRVYFSNLVNLFIIKTHAVMRIGIKKTLKTHVNTYTFGKTFID